MKRSHYYPIAAVWLVAFLLSACVQKNTPPSTQTVAFVYTSAAQTANYIAQSTYAVGTASTATPATTPTPTITLFPSATSFSFSLATSTSNGCDNAAYVADVTFPDNTVVAPGAAFNKTWTIQNTGTCTWSTDYSLTFISGAQMGGATTDLTQFVLPGGKVNITVGLTSPSTNGTYTGYWRMVNGDGVPFGGLVTVVIQVSSSVTSTPTPTVTSTAGPTFTPTPTSAFSPTATATPQNTPTTAPSATSTSTNMPLPSATDTPQPTATSG
ncbi:MAG TPA: NBR1-Ig-like domain-containing protein [Anaerolineales bacterium]|nr:NBR1-Ig-like domain-containing protein [Anaerolineales bacterium]